MLQKNHQIFFKRIIENIIHSEDAFYLTDIEKVIHRHELWKENLPYVTPFYAMKCNSNPDLLKKLIKLGLNFDCASKKEIELILYLGADPERIIFAHTCKQISHLQYAREKGVLKLTFDNEEEIFKIKNYFPNAKLILRIRVDDTFSLGKLAAKFGAEKTNTKNLLKTCKELDLDVIGVSFHVGSNCMSAAPYVDAIKIASEVFNEAEEVGYNLTVLDMGGGFPGREERDELFFDICKTIDISLKNYFSQKSYVKIYAQPGRFYAMQYYTLCTNIIAKKIIIDEEKGHVKYCYSLNAGVFSSFLAHKLGAETLSVPDIVFKRNADDYKLVPYEQLDKNIQMHDSILWGPSCASLDIMTESIMLPELNIGDWLIFYESGAYTETLSCNFNGFPIPKPIN